MVAYGTYDGMMVLKSRVTSQQSDFELLNCYHLKIEQLNNILLTVTAFD